MGQRVGGDSDRRKNQASGAAADKAPPTDGCGAYSGQWWAGEERTGKLKEFLLRGLRFPLKTRWSIHTV